MVKGALALFLNRVEKKVDYKNLPMTHYESMMSKPLNVGEGVSINFGEIVNSLDKRLKPGDNFSEAMRQMAIMFKQDISIVDDMVVQRGDDKFIGTVLHNILYHVWKLKVSGEHIYYMPKNVVNIFQSTDCDVHSSLIKSPSDSFFIYLEDSSIIVDGANEELTMHGLYVNYALYKGLPWVHVMASSGNSKEEIEKNDVVTFFRFPVHEDGKLSDIIDNHFDYTAEMARQNGGGQIQKRDLAAIAKFTVVSMLYLTGQRPDLLPVKPDNLEKKRAAIKNPKKLRRFDKENENKTTKRVTVIGANFPTLDVSRKMGSRGVYELTHPWLVRGHFRSQPYGPRDNPHYETIWIAPYIKGPEGGELIKKRFVLEG